MTIFYNILDVILPYHPAYVVFKFTDRSKPQHSLFVLVHEKL